jgi:hypothetical protein
MPARSNGATPRGFLGLALAGALAVPCAAQGTIRELDGPVGRAWAGVGPKTSRVRLAREDLPRAPEAWSSERPWLDWAELLGAEARARASGSAPDSRRRARLALVAWSQGRSDDAWEHLAACTAEPAWIAAAVPHLAPGVPFDLAAAEGFDPASPLPDGVHLRPALPPPLVPAAEVAHGRAWIEPRELRVEDLAVGAGLVGLRIALEVDGVQVDVEHRGGGAVALSLTLPEPPDFAIQAEYLNWTRRERLGEPIEVRVDASEPQAYVFGRFQPRALPWSETLPREDNAQLLRHGLELRVAPESGSAGRVAGFAAGLEALLGFGSRVRGLQPAPAEPPWPGIVVRFDREAELERKLFALVSLAERYALERASW